MPWRSVLLPTPTACDVRHALLRAERRLQSGKALWLTHNRKCDSDERIASSDRARDRSWCPGCSSRGCGRSGMPKRDLVELAVEVDAVGRVPVAMCDAHLMVLMMVRGFAAHLVYRQARQAPSCVASSRFVRVFQAVVPWQSRPEYHDGNALASAIEGLPPMRS